LKLKEIEMDIAECDAEMAILLQQQQNENDNDDYYNELDEMMLYNQKENLMQMAQEVRQQIDQVRQTNPKRTKDDRPQAENENSMMVNTNENKNPNEESGNGKIISWFQNKMSEWTSFAPSNHPEIDQGDTIDTKMTSSSSSSNDIMGGPYHMMKAIIQEQLNAKVIGTVIENTNLFDDGTIKLGGLIILQRIIPNQSIQIAGETVQIPNKGETYGNLVQGDETILVECYPEEAIGMSLACQTASSNRNDENNDPYSNVRLWIEEDIWKKGSIMMKRCSTRDTINNDGLMTWLPTDPELSILQEGQFRNQSNTERIIPIRIPQSTRTLFDQMFDSNSQQQQQQQKMRRKNIPLFPTENPIKSLSQYDNMSNEEKARTLLMLSNFNGKLPRPRKLRTTTSLASNSASTTERNELDELLLPLIDETVRSQYMIREAINRGDMDLVRQLEERKSRRHIAQENIEKYKQLGMVQQVEQWEKEIRVLETLRADITQDEGSYSQFLDKDEWYEKQRQQTAKNVNRNMFGNLLDGIE
jgi:hypothetical protein